MMHTALHLLVKLPDLAVIDRSEALSKVKRNLTDLISIPASPPFCNHASNEWTIPSTLASEPGRVEILSRERAADRHD